MLDAFETTSKNLEKQFNILGKFLNSGGIIDGILNASDCRTEDYPRQTSKIKIQISIVNFVIENGITIISRCS